MEKSQKVLIVYCSLSGCTKEVALKIKEKLDNASITTELVKADDKDQFKTLLDRDLGQYSSILFGASIMAGNFHKNIHKILAKLDSSPLNGIKLGFFITCMKAWNTQECMEAKAEYIEKHLQKYRLKFTLVEAFGGKTDLSPESSLNFLIKAILKKNMLAGNPALGTIEQKIYDYRNWGQINNFAASWLKLNAQ